MTDCFAGELTGILPDPTEKMPSGCNFDAAFLVHITDDVCLNRKPSFSVSGFNENCFRRLCLNLTDREIIELLENRDEEALRALENRFFPYCMTVALNILENQEDAREVVNDSFLDVWNSIPPAKPERLSAYIATIVRHNAINLYKKLHNHRNEAVSSALPLENAADQTYTVDSVVNQLTVSDAIDRFLKELPEKQSLIFVARFYYDEPIEEIAHKFGIPVGTVKSIIHRLKKALGKFLDGEGINL